MVVIFSSIIGFAPQFSNLKKIFQELLVKNCKAKFEFTKQITKSLSD